MRLRTLARTTLTTAALLTSGCGVFGVGTPKTPEQQGPEAVLDDLGSRIHAGAELIQLEDTWVQLNPHTRGYRVPTSIKKTGWNRLSPTAKTAFCRHNLELAELLQQRYAGDRPQRVAHALETFWRFELPEFGFCRKDPSVASELKTQVEAAVNQVNEDVVIYEAEWAEAKDESLVLLFGNMGRDDRDESLVLSQGEVTGQSTTFEGFKVKERLGKFEIEADYRTRNVVEGRDDRWARLSLGLPWDDTKQILKRQTGDVEGGVLVVPKGTTELKRTTGTFNALDGDALAFSRQSTGEWTWVSWSTRALPAGYTVTRRGDSAVAPKPESPAPSEQPKTKPKPAPQAEPAPEPSSSPTPPPPPDEPVAKSSETYVSPLVWIGFGAGGAFLIAGGVTGGLAASQASDLKDRCGGGSDCGGAITQAELDDATTIAHVSTASFAVAGAGIIVGVIGLFLSDFDGTPDGADSAIMPVVGPGYVGAKGSF